MFGQKPKFIKADEKTIERMKRDPYSFIRTMFGEQYAGGKNCRPDFMIFDDVEEKKCECVNREFKKIEEAFDRVADDFEDVEGDVEMLEDRLDAMQRFLKLEYVKEEVTNVDGFTSVNKFMRKVKAS